MSQAYFHFTLGPVQAFVAQARRTRDFWAGSFILSWLSSVAIKAVQAQGGAIQFPAPQPGYLAWLTGDGQGEPPSQGTIPNRFKALSARVDADFNPNEVVDSVQTAWLALSELIWRGDFATQDLAFGEDRLAVSRQIWERQTQQFWEISWALSDDANASNLLDRRKNWRSQLPPVEPGVKCMMMDGWQELSGLLSPNRQGLDAFWNTLRHCAGDALSVDIRDGEVLCALAYIKRRFARYFAQLKQPMPGGWTLHGWVLPNAVPSLAHIASARWLQSMLKHAKAHGHGDLLETFLQELEQARLELGNEQDAPLPEIGTLCVAQPELSQLATLDGSVWFATQLVQEQDESLRVRQRHALDSALATLNTLQRVPAIGTPHPYYAVLLMDGDSLGSQMSDPAKQAGISAALNRFTGEAPAIVRQHNGFLVYAGGDDVLALLGVSDAMACAAALRACYADCFAEQNRLQDCQLFSTLSGAINIGHIKWPLRALLFDAHQLLDDVAKDQTGRDALAIRVWKHDKPHLCWSQPWDALLSPEGNRMDWLLGHFTGGIISNGFVFKLQSLIEQLGLDKAHHLPQPALASLLRAEYLHSVSQEEHAGCLSPVWFDQLVTLCTPHTRNLLDRQATLESSHRLQADGALLLRFLQQAYTAAGAVATLHKEPISC